MNTSSFRAPATPAQSLGLIKLDRKRIHAAAAVKLYRKYQAHAAQIVTTGAVACLLTPEKEQTHGILRSLPASHVARLLEQTNDTQQFVDALPMPVRRIMAQAARGPMDVDDVLTWIVHHARNGMLPLDRLERASKAAMNHRVVSLQQQFPAGTRVSLDFEGEIRTGCVEKPLRRKIRIVLDRDGRGLARPSSALTILRGPATSNSLLMTE
jgi:hypothetical protein